MPISSIAAKKEERGEALVFIFVEEMPYGRRLYNK